ncbi:MAG: mannose-1-phosphate guanylyltransferase [Bdellovibrionota bacterium]
MAKISSHFHAVILAGGPGTRLWPLSTVSLPKPYLPIPGPRTLIEEAWRRARLLAPPSRIWIVATRAQRPLLRRYLPQVPSTQILFEPEARNTAPAMAFAAAAVLKRDPRAVLAVLPADHVVEKPHALARALSQAAAFCEKNYGIVCMGVKPTSPATGYGYLELTGPTRGGVRKVGRFIEKPDLAKAKKLVRQRSVFWNAGMFVFRAEVLINEFEQHLSPLHRAVTRALKERSLAACVRNLTRQYKNLPVISIDYGVMEKTRHAYAAACDCGWSDVGNWVEALRISKRGIRAPSGSAFLLKEGLSSHGGRSLALVGFEEAALVETKDALLIVHPAASAGVGAIAKEAARRRK